MNAAAHRRVTAYVNALHDLDDTLDPNEHLDAVFEAHNGVTRPLILSDIEALLVECYKARAVAAAWNAESRIPWFQRQARSRLRTSWPTLALAIERLAR